MICILAADRREAEIWARGQFLSLSEWFCPESEYDLYRSNYHVITLDGFAQLPASFRERIFQVAQERGSNGRK